MRNVMVGLLTFLLASTAWGQEKLDLSGPGTTDEVLAKKVKGLTNLKGLGLDESEITDAGLVHLLGLSKLQKLGLYATNVTDAGLVHLKGLTNLKVLDLNGTQITDSGLVHLRGLTNLASLDLKNTQVTDAGLVHLKGFTNLTKLELPIEITDAGLVHLEGLRKLEELNFAWYKTSSYKGIGTSRMVHAMILKKTQVSDAGVRELKKALPSCVIERSPYDIAR